MSTPTLVKAITQHKQSIGRVDDTRKTNIFNGTVVQHEDKQNAILHLKYDLERQVQHTNSSDDESRREVDAYIIT
jgi:K+/H+ antiporter YhaU regulatory subunit KhtT